LISIPSEIGMLSSLRTLDLSNNKIIELPVALCHLKSLRALIINDNLIKHLPNQWFDDNSNYRTSLSNEQGAEEVSNKIVPFETLFELSLANNQLEEIHPNFFLTFSSLRVLHIMNNKIMEIPKSIYYAREMVELHMAGNHINNFPEELTTLTKLKKLSLFRNNITKLPQQLSSLTELHTLLLGYNRDLWMFDCSLPDSLREVHLAQCGLTSIPSSVSKLPSLERLSLGFNKLTDFADDNPLVTLPSLKYVDIQHNRLQRIPATLLDRMKEEGFELYYYENPLKEKVIPPKSVRQEEMCSSVRGNGCSFGCSEMIGKRTAMEDFVTINSALNSDPEMDLVVLLDGHGGDEMAKMTAQLFPKVFEQMLQSSRKNKNDESRFKKLLQDIFIKLHQICRDELQKIESRTLDDLRSGATCLAGFFYDRHLYIANVGDCRAVLCRSGQALKLSKDHRPLMEEERKRIKKLGGYVAENGRVNSVLGVSRALGDYYLQPLISCEPDVFPPINLQPDKDEFIIFACDGVWDVLSDEQAVAIVRECLKESPEDAHLAASTLRDHAFLYESGDNITVVVAIVVPKRGVMELP